jgi:hypothetical protein
LNFTIICPSICLSGGIGGIVATGAGVVLTDTFGVGVGVEVTFTVWEALRVTKKIPTIAIIPKPIIRDLGVKILSAVVFSILLLTLKKKAEAVKRS